MKIGDKDGSREGQDSLAASVGLKMESDNRFYESRDIADDYGEAEGLTLYLDETSFQYQNRHWRSYSKNKFLFTRKRSTCGKNTKE